MTKISQLPQDSAPTGTDYIVSVDTETGQTKRILLSDLFGSPLLPAVGTPVQIVSTNYTTLATGIGVIPYDNTIPQNTEGDQYMSQTIVPKSATNRLSIEITAQASSSASNHLIAALFQDSTVGALAATAAYMLTATGSVILKLVHDMDAGATSSTTFKVRLGQEGAGTITFNGQNAVQRFGGITISNIKITEYKN